MKFLVSLIEDYSKSCNKVMLRFVNSKYSKLGVEVFVPKTITLEKGKEQEIPKFVCDTIFYSDFAIKSLKKQIKFFEYDEKEFFKWFCELEKSNIEEVKGNFVGGKGMEITAKFSVVNKLFERPMFYPGFSCVKTGWHLEDEEKNVFVVFTTSKKINTYFLEHKEVILDARIEKQEIYHGVRQNILKVKEIVESKM